METKDALSYIKEREEYYKKEEASKFIEDLKLIRHCISGHRDAILPGSIISSQELAHMQFLRIPNTMDNSEEMLSHRLKVMRETEESQIQDEFEDLSEEQKVQLKKKLGYKYFLFIVSRGPEPPTAYNIHVIGNFLLLFFILNFSSKQ